MADDLCGDIDVSPRDITLVRFPCRTRGSSTTIRPRRRTSIIPACLARPKRRSPPSDNGLRVASESNMSAETATVGVWIDAGSQFGTAETKGTAHFLEHMFFRGTKKRNFRQLEEEIENMGGHLNAYTSLEQTTYYAKVLKKDVPVAVDIFADILRNSSFEEERINRERNVILREIEEMEGQVEAVMFDHLHATAFQTMRVVAAAGAVNHDELVKTVEKSFQNPSTDPTTAVELLMQEPASFTGSEVRLRDDDCPLAYFAVALKGAAWTDPDHTGDDEEVDKDSKHEYCADRWSR